MQAHVEAAEAAADWELGSIPDADAVATTMRDAVDAVAQAQRVFALGKECVWAGTDSEVPLFVPGRVVVRQQTFPIMDQDDEEPNPNYSVWLFSDALMYGAFTADQRYEIVGLISLEPSASPTVDCPKARGKLRNSFRVDHTGGHLSVVCASEAERDSWAADVARTVAQAAAPPAPAPAAAGGVAPPPAAPWTGAGLPPPPPAPGGPPAGGLAPPPPADGASGAGAGAASDADAANTKLRQRLQLRRSNRQARAPASGGLSIPPPPGAAAAAAARAAINLPPREPSPGIGIPPPPAAVASNLPPPPMAPPATLPPPPAAPSMPPPPTGHAPVKPPKAGLRFAPPPNP